MGAFTQTIVKGKIPFKKIHIANQSKEEIKVFKEKMPSKHNKNIDTHLIKSVKIPKEVQNADAFISFNDLGYVENIPRFIQEVKKALNKGGKFCFYIKSHFLNVAPNAILVNDRKKIVEMFKKEKLEVNYSKKSRLFKTEIFVYGKKK